MNQKTIENILIPYQIKQRPTKTRYVDTGKLIINLDVNYKSKPVPTFTIINDWSFREYKIFNYEQLKKLINL